MLVKSYKIGFNNFLVYSIKIFKTTKPRSEEGGNDGGKSGGDDGRGNRHILEVGPHRRTMPQAMGHDVLEGNIVVKG